MNNEIPYYSTISRYEIYRRIMEYAGQEWSLEDFVANDVVESVSTASTKGGSDYTGQTAAMNSHEPVFMGERPQIR